MFEVFVWVPTRGWKLVGRYKTEEKAVERAEEFDPLETRLSRPSGPTTYAGRGVEVDFDRPLSNEGHRPVVSR